MIRVASALSTELDTAKAVFEAARRVCDELGEAPDLALVFVSPHHLAATDAIPAGIADVLGPRHLAGCTGEWIVGDGREVEGEPAVSLWAAVLPGAGLETFHAQFFRAGHRAGFGGFPDIASDPGVKGVLLLAEPFSFPADGLLGWASQNVPEVPFVGGMASGGTEPGRHRLFRDSSVYDSGAVGAILRGDVEIHTIVSQGCRPIGRSFVVTRAENNLILELAGRPALERLQEVIAKAGDRDRELATRGLHIGIVMNEYKEEFGRGDFLIRGVLGADPNSGGIAVGEVVEVGRTVQFQVRDAASAHEDLRDLLSELAVRPSGALLFTCNGRGSRLFGAADHDVTVIRAHAGEIPVAGFFCNGEIGPVGGRNFLHGFTASVAFFAAGQPAA